MGASSQLTLVLLNSCFGGHCSHLQDKPGTGNFRTEQRSGADCGTSSQSLEGPEIIQPAAGRSCNHIHGQLALPRSRTEVIPIDTAKLSKLEGEKLPITLLLSIFLLLGNRDLCFMFPSGSAGAVSSGSKVNTTCPFVVQTIPFIMWRWCLACIGMSLDAFASYQN